MVTMPGVGGGLSVTGDPDLERVLSGAQAELGGPGGFGGQNPFGPSATKWLYHWDPPVVSTEPKPPFGPGSPGFGVLREAPKPSMFDKISEQQKLIAEREKASKKQGEDRKRLQELADAVAGKPAMPTDLADQWGWALEQMDAAEAMGADPRDPWYWLERLREDAQKPDKPKGPTTHIQRTINLTDPTTAAAVIDTTLRNLLGRRATEEERRQFTAALRSQEESDPAVTTSVTTYAEDGSESTTSSTTESGAPDPGTAAQQFADERLGGERKAMLAASYYNILAGL